MSLGLIVDGWRTTPKTPNWQSPWNNWEIWAKCQLCFPHRKAWDALLPFPFLRHTGRLTLMHIWVLWCGWKAQTKHPASQLAKLWEDKNFCRFCTIHRAVLMFRAVCAHGKMPIKQDVWVPGIHPWADIALTTVPFAAPSQRFIVC